MFYATPCVRREITRDGTHREKRIASSTGARTLAPLPGSPRLSPALPSSLSSMSALAGVGALDGGVPRFPRARAAQRREAGAPAGRRAPARDLRRSTQASRLMFRLCPIRARAASSRPTVCALISASNAREKYGVMIVGPSRERA